MYGGDEGSGRSSTPVVGVQEFMGTCIPIVYMGLYGSLPAGHEPTNADGPWADSCQTCSLNYFVALNGNTGALIWAYFPNSGTIEGGATLGPNGTVILEGWGSNMVALDAQTGHLRWTAIRSRFPFSQDRNPGLLVLDSGVLVRIAGGGHVVALNGSSTPVWSSNSTAACLEYNYTTGVVDSDGTCSNTLSSGAGLVFVPNFGNSTVAALDELTGKVVWNAQLNSYADTYFDEVDTTLQCSTVAPQFSRVKTGLADFDALFVRACTTLFILDAADGSVVQTHHFDGCASYSPGVVTEEGHYYFLCDSRGALEAVNYGLEHNDLACELYDRI